MIKRQGQAQCYQGQWPDPVWVMHIMAAKKFNKLGSQFSSLLPHHSAPPTQKGLLVAASEDTIKK